MQKTQQQSNQFDLSNYIRILWNGKKLVAGIFLLTVILAIVYSYHFVEPVYETVAEIQLTNMPEASNFQDVVQLLTSVNFIEPVLNDIYQDYTTDKVKKYIKNNINVSIIQGSNVVYLSVRNKNPQLTNDIAKKIIDKFIKETNSLYSKIYANKQQYLELLKNQVKDFETEIVNISKEMKVIINSNITEGEKSLLINSYTTRLDLLINNKSETNDKIHQLSNQLITYYPTRLISSPYVPGNPVSPNKKLIIGIAGFCALIFSTLILFFFEYIKLD